MSCDVSPLLCVVNPPLCSDNTALTRQISFKKETKYVKCAHNSLVSFHKHAQIQSIFTFYYKNKKVFRDVHGCILASIHTIGVAMSMLNDNGVIFNTYSILNLTRSLLLLTWKGTQYNKLHASQYTCSLPVSNACYSSHQKVITVTITFIVNITQCNFIFIWQF